MRIRKFIDFEDEIRESLSAYLDCAVYVHELPRDMELPCVRVWASPIQRVNLCDTYRVTLDVRAETEAEAQAVYDTAGAVLEAVAASGETSMRHAALNSGADWGSDPARPDLALKTLTYLVTAHPVTEEV